MTPPMTPEPMRSRGVVSEASNVAVSPAALDYQMSDECKRDLEAIRQAALHTPEQTIVTLRAELAAAQRERDEALALNARLVEVVGELLGFVRATGSAPTTPGSHNRARAAAKARALLEEVKSHGK